jgi:hypothetical protein
MINHRSVNRRWRLLLPSISVLLFPLASFSQTWVSFISDGGGSVLGSDGFAYYPLGSGVYLPGQTTPMSEMMWGLGSCGATTSPKGNPCPQLVGLGKQDGLAYLVAFGVSSNTYTEALLPGQGTRFSQLAVGMGWGNDGALNNPNGGFTIVYTSNFLQVIGLGANDGLAYLAAFQDPNGTWHSAGILPGQTVPFSQLYVVTGNAGKLQVIGRAVSDNRLYLTAYQDNNGNWQSGGLLPGQSPGLSFITTANGNFGPSSSQWAEVQVLGLGASDGYIYLPDWQDSSGTWHAAGILPGQTTPLENIVATRLEQGNENDGWYFILIVGGLGASDHILHITDWQDASGTWHAYTASSLGIQIPQVPMSAVSADSGLLLPTEATFWGIGQNDNHLYVLANDITGTWSSGYDATALVSGPPSVPALSSSTTSLKEGNPYTISWTFPSSGLVNHFTLSTRVNGGTATLTTIPYPTISQTETGLVSTTTSFGYTVRACSSADESYCSAWSNTVQVSVNVTTGGGGCPHCR